MKQTISTSVQTVTAIFLVASLLMLPAVLHAGDSALVAAAKKEQARRAKVNASKSFSNEDVHEFISAKRAAGELEEASVDIQDESFEDPESPTAAPAAFDESESSAGQAEARDREYWQNELSNRRAAVSQAQLKYNDLQRRHSQDQEVNAQAQAELDAARENLENFGEDARRAGALPGWIRE